MKLLEESWQPPADHGYALLEPSNRPHFVEEAALAGLPCTPCGAERSEHLMPRLIDLGRASESDRELFQDLCSGELSEVRPPFICAWFASDLTVNELSALVAEPLVGSIGGRRLLWRYYDPRVLSLAYSVLTPMQRDALFHGIKSWAFPWSSQWWCIEGHQSCATHLERAYQSWPSNDQWMTISSSEIVHRIHSEIRARRTIQVRDLHVVQQLLVSGMREAAVLLRLQDSIEQAEYARLLVLYGDAFRYHRSLEGLRSKVASGRMAWAEFCNAVSEDELERLIDGVRSYSLS
ncbi:hypothetical protein [Pseudoduganella sp.]|uniref:hypothetical protein n=1 Tax=Pseudoduganella sp. TaxID=1880898 RepID=UPI0035B4CB9B